MQDKFTLDYSFIDSYKRKQNTPAFERHGIQVKTGALQQGPLQLMVLLLRALEWFCEVFQ